MAENNAAQLFDTVASDYEKFRPGYPDLLYKTLFDYATLNSSGNAAEIGIGAGQASLPVLKTGCRLTAIEYGSELSALCSEKFKDFPNFTVITGKFEDTPLPESSFDLVYSASAFHWIPEKTGYRKVFSLLKSGGAFARFANRPFPGNDDTGLSRDLERIYAEYYYPFHNREPAAPKRFTAEQAAAIAGIPQKYGFTDIKYAIFRRTRKFTAGEYIKLLGTYSDHIAIEEQTRKAFFSAIEKAVNVHGGEITVSDTIDLELARKP